MFSFYHKNEKVFSENHFLDTLRKKENDAYRYLYDNLFIPMRSVAYNYTKDKAVAEELVQDAFIALLEYEGIFDTVIHVKRYLYTILKNRCIDWTRRQQVKFTYESNMLNQSENNIFDFWDNVLAEDLNALLLKAIDTLPPQCRKVMQHTLEERKIAEIASLMHISEETVKDYRRTSKQKLKQFFKKEFLCILSFISF